MLKCFQRAAFIGLDYWFYKGIGFFIYNRILDIKTAPFDYSVKVIAVLFCGYRIISRTL